MRRSLGRPAVLLLGLLALGSPAAAVGAPSPGVVHGPEGLTLSASPTSGTAPLSVRFELSTPNGTPPYLEWAFGDGRFLNGSGANTSAPVHVYLEAGSFLCVVTAVYPKGSVNASVPIDVRTGNVTVSVTASPSSGTVPLTVWLNGTVSGGTGTYLGYRWSFGNGQNGSGLSVRYTFDAAGTFPATLTVTDSADRNGSATVDVRVRAVEGGDGDAARLLTEPIVLIFAAIGAVALVASFLWVRSSRRSAQRSTLPAGGDAARGPPAPPEALPAPASPGAVVAVGASDGPEPDGAPRGEAGAERPAALTYGILRHLAGLPRVSPGDAMVPREFTQAGIAEGLGAGQSAVSRVLRRLVAAGAIEVSTRHVQGSERRLRVYTLTDRGERLGRALRESPGVPGGGGPPPPPG